MDSSRVNIPNLNDGNVHMYTGHYTTLIVIQVDMIQVTVQFIRSIQSKTEPTNNDNNNNASPHASSVSNGHPKAPLPCCLKQRSAVYDYRQKDIQRGHGPNDPSR